MRSKNWYTLDNSAKIMPSTTTNLNTNVFRLSCTLTKSIDAKILQEALDKTLIEFPMFLYTMKDGLFWHYLEKSDFKPLVKEENEAVCSRIDNGLLFRVSYYKKRINLEVYHVLSDGNGSMEFLKYLVCTYLNIKENLSLNIPLNDSSIFEKEKNDFQTFDKSSFKIDVKNVKRSYKLNFQKKDTIHHDIIEVHLSVNNLKKITKKYNTTITIYLTAVYIKSIIENIKVKDLKKPIGITIPVDLRNTFPSKTIRNFFYTFLVTYKASDKNVELSDIIISISKQFEKCLTKENLQKKINSFMLLEKILFIRIIPNFIKNFALKYFAIEGKKGQTTVLSNLGVVKLPNDYEKFISSFCALSSTEDIQLTVCSFNDNLVLGFASHFVNKNIERIFIREIQKELDNELKIITNVRGDDI